MSFTRHWFLGVLYHDVLFETKINLYVLSTPNVYIAMSQYS